MNTNGMTNDEVIDKLLEMVDNGEKITLDDIDECISTRSIVDHVADENAITIFYSGEPGKVINYISDNSGSDVRMIRRTEAFDFVANKDFEKIVKYVVKNEFPELLTDEAIKKKVNDLFYEASYYDAIKQYFF